MKSGGETHTQRQQNDGDFSTSPLAVQTTVLRRSFSLVSLEGLHRSLQWAEISMVHVAPHQGIGSGTRTDERGIGDQEW